MAFLKGNSIEIKEAILQEDVLKLIDEFEKRIKKKVKKKEGVVYYSHLFEDLQELKQGIEGK